MLRSIFIKIFLFLLISCGTRLYAQDPDVPHEFTGESQVEFGEKYYYELTGVYNLIDITWSIQGGTVTSAMSSTSREVKWDSWTGGAVGVSYHYRSQDGSEIIAGYLNIIACVIPDAGPNRIFCQAALPFKLTGNPAGGTWSGPYVSSDGTISSDIPAGNYTFTYSTGLCGDGSERYKRILVDVIQTYNAPSVSQSTVYTCQGESHSVTASSSQGNVFRWYAVPGGSALPVHTGNVFSYAPPDEERHDFYVCVANQICESARTKVSFIPNAPDAISGGKTTCAPATVTVTVTTTSTIDGWERSINGGSSWQTIATAPQAASYTYIETESALIRAIVNKGSCKVRSQSASIIITKSVGGTPVAQYTVNQCSNIQGTITLGDSKTGEIQDWYVSNDKATWKKLTGVDNNAVPFHITDTAKYYRAIVQLGSCTSATSEIIAIQAKAYAGPVKTLSQANCNVASGTLELLDKYGEVSQWQKTETPGDSTSWKAIPGSANSIYAFTNVTASTYFRAAVSLSNCPGTAYSPVSSILISNPPKGILARNDQANACDSVSASNITLKGQFKLKDYAGAVVRWEKLDSNGIWQIIANTVGKTSYDYAIKTTTKFRARLSENGCDNIYSGEATVYVNLAFKGTVNKVTTVKEYDGHSYLSNGSFILSKGFKFYANSCQSFSITIDENYTVSHSNENFVLEETIKKEGVKELEDVNWLGPKDKNSEYNYMDGLGRPMQKVSRKASPNQFDLVQPVKYDFLGRVEYNYLAYADSTKDGTYKEDFEVRQREFYAKDNDAIANSLYPFARKVFDGSPLNRVIEQGAPGTAWQPLPVEGGGKTTKIEYLTNTETDIKIWTVLDSLPVSEENYKANELLVNVTINEKGLKVKQYLNKLGQTILKKVESRDKKGDTLWLQTYIIYNDFGKESFVLPPEAVKNLAGNPTDDFLERWAFCKRYDARQRVIATRIPGADWAYAFYDKGDRIKLTQDAVQRKRKEFKVIKYDDLGRAIMTALWKDSVDQSRSKIQQLIDQESQWYEEKSDSGQGYTLNKSFPTIRESQLLTVDYYDDYSFLNTTYFDRKGFAYYVEAGSPIQYNGSIKGRHTGAKVKVLKSNVPVQWIRSINYYDHKYRPVQSIQENHIGGLDRSTTAYDFSGKALIMLHSHKGYGADTIVIKESFAYDHVGRLLTRDHKIGSQSKVNMVQNAYNELGTMIEKNLHGTSTGFLQSIDYRYNIRGWITSINNAAFISDGGVTNNDVGDAFGMELKYNEGLIFGQSVAQFNGNIAEVTWKNSQDNKLKGYSYAYDAINRLVSARYRAFVNNSWNNVEAGRYDEEIAGYDLNGNILALNRTGANGYNATTSAHLFGAMDSLIYQYDANRLLAVNDKVTDGTAPTGFKPEGFSKGVASNQIFDISNPATYDYDYDENGCLIKDKTKGIANFTYNIFNKVERIAYTDGRYITYTYDTEGNKLGKNVYDSLGKGLDSTTYVGSFEYKGHALQHILTGEGRLVLNGSNFSYEYFLTDHLGNVRASVDVGPDGNARVIQVNDYYPFGLGQGGQSYVAGKENLYKFGAKEEQKEWGVIDFGARNYDPVLGRWNVIDPLASEYLRWSPYNYTLNNPVRFVDPDGRFVGTLVGAVLGGVIGGVRAAIKGENVWKGAGKGAVSGAIAGAVFDVTVATGGAGLGVLVVAGGLSGAAGNTVDQLFETGKVDGKQVAASALIGGVLGYAGGKLAGPIARGLGRLFGKGRTVTGGGILTNAEAEAQIAAEGAVEIEKRISQSLLSWEELEHQAIMSSKDLKVATSTDGSTFRAVVQNIEEEYGDNVARLLSKLNTEATEAGASTLEIKGIEIVNDKFRKIFQSSNGKTLMGYTVNYLEKNGYGQVNLTKKLRN